MSLNEAAQERSAWPASGATDALLRAKKLLEKLRDVKQLDKGAAHDPSSLECFFQQERTRQVAKVLVHRDPALFGASRRYSGLAFWLHAYLFYLDREEGARIPYNARERRWRAPLWEKVWPERYFEGLGEGLGEGVWPAGSDGALLQARWIEIGTYVDALFLMEARELLEVLGVKTASLKEEELGEQFGRLFYGEGRSAPATWIASARGGVFYQRLLGACAERCQESVEEDASDVKQLDIRALYPKVLEKCEQSWSARGYGLNQEQKEAVEKVLGKRFFVLTGGPGTGKTFTLTRMIEALEALQELIESKLEGESRSKKVSFLDIALCAPTGKARERLAQMAGGLKNAKLFTLHKLLNIGAPSYLRPSSLQPLPYHLVILDEASMVNEALFLALLRALDPRTLLVLVGDPRQLPPIEGKSPLTSLIALMKKKRSSKLVELQESRRVASTLLQEIALGMLEERNALQSASWIDQTLRPHHQQEFNPSLLDRSDFTWVDQAQVEVSWKERKDFLAKLASYYAPLYCLETSLEQAVRASSRLRLLCSHARGVLGARVVNEAFLDDLFAREAARERVDQPLYLPLIITKNQESHALVNGQMALIELSPSLKAEVVRESLLAKMRPSSKQRGSFFTPEGVKPHLHYAKVFLETATQENQRPARSLLLGQIEAWDWAFALTIHKSQGSEFDRVALILSEGAENWGKSLLYTGWTRAKKKVDLFAKQQLLKELFISSESGPFSLSLLEATRDIRGTREKRETRDISVGDLDCDLALALDGPTE